MKHSPPSLETFVEKCWIEDKDAGGLTPFLLWDCQKKVLKELGSNKRVIILKARQLGLTWLVLAFYLYNTTFWGGKTIILASRREDECKELLRRVKLMHDSLPPEWRASVASGDYSKMSMSFENGSRFVVQSATQNVARSYSPWAAVIDEMAFMPFQSEMWASVDPAAPRVTCLSTGYRKADLYYDLWKSSWEKSKDSEFAPIFLPWDAHPDRDENWYRIHVENAVRPRLARREYPRTPTEAFSSAEGLFFERFDQTRHMPEKDHSPVDHWQTWRAVDFGYIHSACVWLQQSPEGQIFVVGELCPRRVTTGELATQILAQDRILGVNPMGTFCDPAGYAKNTQTAMSDMEIFKHAGLAPIAKQSSFRDGCVLIQEYLCGQKPIQINNGCNELVASFETLEPDRLAPDVYAKDPDFGHVMDAFRYGMVNLILGASGRMKRWTDDQLAIDSRAVTSGLFSKIF